jgi:hypothetical protein
MQLEHSVSCVDGRHTEVALLAFSNPQADVANNWRRILLACG